MKFYLSWLGVILLCGLLGVLIAILSAPNLPVAILIIAALPSLAFVGMLRARR